MADVNAATVADINTGFGMLETPLHYAAKHGAVTICDKLIDAGANVGATTTEGWTPLLFAAQVRRAWRPRFGWNSPTPRLMLITRLRRGAAAMGHRPRRGTWR